MNSKKQNNITAQINNLSEQKDLDLDKLEKLVNTICARFHIKNAVIDISIVENEEIKKLNKKFLNRNQITDCISFDLSNDDTNTPKLFTIIVNAQKALEEAKAREHTIQAEIALYITHGILHNLGFNDSTATQAQKMHQTEDEILQQLGYGLVYNKDTEIKK
ncbi:MAG: rRNA maturation RNase YbeY [Sedimentisphaerales bacterium]|nr:rRNA maturation RNase YbeY [Sedimentisphaerales bacterium]